MAEANKKFCDLALVRVDDANCIVELKPGIAKLGDRVDFLIKDVGLVCGFVDDILSCEILGDTHCFIGTAVQIFKPAAIYHRVWTNENLLDGIAD